MAIQEKLDKALKEGRRILCRVSDFEDDKEGSIEFVNFKDESSSLPYDTDKSVYEFAIPVSLDEIKQFILEV